MLPRCHVADGLRPHPDTPEPFASTEPEPEPEFDVAKHLRLEPPAKVKTLAFEEVKYPYTEATRRRFPGLAYTEPFRLLSEEGVRALRSVIDSREGFARQNSRNLSIRGLSYLSKFVRDFTYCPELVRVFSDLAQEKLWPHNMPMNHGQTNYGKIGTGRAVDQWHVDSTDYVFVLILSDIREMKGGELQVLQMADSSGATFDKLQMNGIPKHLIETVNYSQAGFCIFMQGSRILHSVTPVLRAREPRISFVQSWSNLNVFAPDRTRLSTFRDQAGDPAHVANLEFARHKAWRIMGQMQFVKDKMKFDAKDKDIAKVFENACKELKIAARVILKAETDVTGFIRNDKDTISKKGEFRGGSNAKGMMALSTSKL